MTDQDPFLTIQQERSQDHSTRRPLFQKLADCLDRPIVTFLTSFRHQAAMLDTDAEMLENVLRGEDLSNGIALLISSPGGLPLAAERIIRILRSYSGTNEYWGNCSRKSQICCDNGLFWSKQNSHGSNIRIGAN